MSPSRGRAVPASSTSGSAHGASPCTCPAQLNYPDSHPRKKTGSKKEITSHFEVEFNERLRPELSLVLWSFLKHREICYHDELKIFLQWAVLKCWPQTPNLPGFGHNPIPDLPWIKPRGAPFLTQFISISPWGCDCFTLPGRFFPPFPSSTSRIYCHSNAEQFLLCTMKTGYRKLICWLLNL